MSPRTFPPAPGWSPDGHRLKAPLDYGRGPDKTRGYGALCPRDGHTLTLPARSRNTAGFQALLEAIDAAYPLGAVHVIADNLSSHTSAPIQAWLAEHPRFHPEPLPTGACWLNLIEPWWKTLRSLALKGRRFETWEEVCAAVREATAYWNAHRHPFVWGRRRRHQPRRLGLGALPKAA